MIRFATEKTFCFSSKLVAAYAGEVNGDEIIIEEAHLL